ncbi:MAG: hypothetical protein JWL84_2657 [Rhodospirillales bacterium]|nr:hypothetical protein [Rhodospirillales bacterium]
MEACVYFPLYVNVRTSGASSQHYQWVGSSLCVTSATPVRHLRRSWAPTGVRGRLEVPPGPPAPIGPYPPSQPVYSGRRGIDAADCAALLQENL